MKENFLCLVREQMNRYWFNKLGMLDDMVSASEKCSVVYMSKCVILLLHVLVV